LSFFLFADQNLIAPNLKNIGASLGLVEQADIDWYLGGLIPIFFFILGGLVSISMGYLSQIFSRKKLLILTVILGETSCLLTAYARDYNEFLILRTLCGFGLGGIFPLLFSIIGDYFSNTSRAIATGFVSLSMGLGVGIGQLVGGILGEADPVNGWRLSFLYLSIPSFFFAAIFSLYNLTDDLGKGLGPAMSAAILLRTTDRPLALSISILFWIPCSLFWWIIIKNYAKDEILMQKELEHA
jgi:MFS family permease